MGKFQDSKTIRRISGPGLFNWELFWWSYLILFIPQILFDVFAFEVSELIWLPVWTAGHLAATVVAIGLRVGWLDRLQAQRPSATINLAVAGLLGIIRVGVIGYLSFVLGLVAEFDLLMRILAGVIQGTILFAFITNLLESTREYRNDFARLRATSNQLKSLKKSTAREIRSIQNEMESTTRSVIEPRLRKILGMLAGGSVSAATRRTAAYDIKDILENQVRPIISKLRSTSKLLDNPRLFRGVSRASLFRFPDKVRPELGLNVGLVFVSQLAILPITLYIVGSNERIPLGVGIALLNTMIVYLAKKYFEKRDSVPISRAMAELFLIVLVITALDFLILVASGLASLASSLFTVLVFVVLINIIGGQGLIAAHEYNRADFLRRIERNNAKIERELALLNQRVWVEKRQWALRVHGTVQASLTAAVARLSHPGKLTSADQRMISKHIASARSGLASKGEANFELAKAIRELVKTWSGVVEIKVNLRSDAAKLLLADKWAGVCANEIIKEAVSNSFRHGSASKVQVGFRNSGAGFVEILVQDDGRGISKKRKEGLGSQLLDEIAYPWSLVGTAEGALLSARIPVAKKTR